MFLISAVEPVELIARLYLQQIAIKDSYNIKRYPENEDQVVGQWFGKIKLFKRIFK